MRKSVRGNISYANVMATVAVFVALGGGAYAASGRLVAGNGAIKACVSKKGGALRVVKSNRHCPKGTSNLSFNQKGPIGPVGPAGAAGAVGPQGPAGITGETRWGNVQIAEGGPDKVVATIGPFTLSARCDVTGDGSYWLTTTATGDWVYGEDSSSSELTPGTAFEILDDEDSDEAFYASSVSTGVTIDGVAFNWDKGHGTPNSCQFQGHVTQTS